MDDVNSSPMNILGTLSLTINLYKDSVFQVGILISCVKIIYDIFVHHVTFFQFFSIKVFIMCNPIKN